MTRSSTVRRSIACGLAMGIAAAGCAVPGQMLTSPGDLTEYRSFRMATTAGNRLARAQAYLDHHPRGRWADEVRVAFDREEEAYFEAAKSSRSRALDYVVTLPRGPHVEAARALLVLFDQKEANLDTLELLASWRKTSAILDLQAAQRRRVGEVVLDELAALLDEDTPGARLDDPPRVLAGVLRGPVPRTWGVGPNGLRDDQIFFGVPTVSETQPQPRVAEVHFQLVLERGRVRGGRIEGDDLFVRWIEANEVRVLDASNPTDRAVAAASVVDLLSGALEARLPQARCNAHPRPSEILVRACDGWNVSVRMGKAGGQRDMILVRTGEIRPALSPGMR